MKKLILIFIVALMLTACGSNSKDNITTETTTQVAEATTIETTIESTTIETTTETTTIETTTEIATEIITIEITTKKEIKEAEIPTATSVVNSDGAGNGNNKTNSSISNEKDYVTVESKNNSSNTVWIGDKGTKYHNKDCRTLRGNKYEITYDEAIRQGRKACKVCH